MCSQKITPLKQRLKKLSNWLQNKVNKVKKSLVKSNMKNKKIYNAKKLKII